MPRTVAADLSGRWTLLVLGISENLKKPNSQEKALTNFRVPAKNIWIAEEKAIQYIPKAFFCYRGA